MKKILQKAKDWPGSYENSIGENGTDSSTVGVSTASLGQTQEETTSTSDAAATAQESTANPSGSVPKTTIADGKMLVIKLCLILSVKLSLR